MHKINNKWFCVTIIHLARLASFLQFCEQREQQQHS